MKRFDRIQQLSIGTILLVAAMLGTAADALALPRFSLLSGTRCSACHFNPQGSGLRNELGWSAMNQVGAFSLSDIGLDSLFPEFSNSYADGLITPGIDVRLQMARLGRPPEAPRRVIPMQTTAYLAVTPSEWLSVYGSYNFSTLRYRYAGQTPWDAAIQIQPDYTLPNIRVGYIQPSIGVRHDDHTLFIRREVARNGTPIIPPYYNELGAELTYEGTSWLTLNAGIFNARNLTETESSIGPIDSYLDFSKPSYLVRAQLWPQLLDEGINAQIGASYFGNGDFSMINAFAGIGLADKATIMGEAMVSRNARDRRVRNFSILGSYQLWQWLALEWRYEWGQTEDPSFGVFHAHSFVAGAQFFLLPSLELRPEYRFFQNQDYLQGQYTLQVHLFY